MHYSEELERNQMIENVEQVIEEVKGVHRFTGGPDLIVDGDQEATLELVWWVIFIVQLLKFEHRLDEQAVRQNDK